MVPLDLREFADQRYRDGEPFARELLDLLDQEPMIDLCHELLEQLKKASGLDVKNGEEWRHVEFLEGKATELEKIDDLLKTAGFDQMGIDDRVTEVLANLEDAETEVAALRKELEELKAPKLEYDL